MGLSLVMPVSALDGQVQAERREGYDVATIHYTDGEGNEQAIPFTDMAKADDAKVIEAFFNGTLDGQGHRIINLYYVTADGDKIDAPAALTLTWASGTGTLEEVAAKAENSGSIRFCYGISADQYGSAAGKRLVSGVTSVTLTACAHTGKTAQVPEVPATCTETGLTAGVRCTDCGK